MPDKSALNITVALNIGIMRNDFRDLLEPHASRYFTYGRVFLHDQTHLASFSTFAAEEPIKLWGDATSQDHYCGTCNRNWHVPYGEWHLRKSDLTGQSIYECDCGGIIVDEELRQRILPGVWKGIHIQPTPVFDE